MLPDDSQKKKLAYIFDDDPSVGQILTNLLSASGIQTRQFTTEVRFFAAMRGRSPDMVLLDLGLGHTDAVDVIRSLDLIRYGGAVMLISGMDREVLNEVQEIGLSHGLAMLPPMKKPFRAADIREALAHKPHSQAVIPLEEAHAVQAHVQPALDNRWLEVWYQPKIDLRTLTVCGAEALARVQHPEFGLIHPPNFLPAAADPNHFRLFSYVLERVVRDWTVSVGHRLNLRVAINIPASVLRYDLADIVRKVLPKSKYFPGLILEISENDVISDPSYARETATQLKLYNVLLSVDDFGSNAASLGRLRKLPFYELKLDRQFVADCATDRQNRAICEAAVRVGHHVPLGAPDTDALQSRLASAGVSVNPRSQAALSSGTAR
jgi:EAL domain-containing protein (putative c-di-GMP-specific phosphodiesterase class I)/FixJ family two-component response regulator